MSDLKEKARSAVEPTSHSSAWGHIFGAAAFLVVVVFIPSWAEAFTMPKVIVLTALGFAAIPLIWTRRASLAPNRVPLAMLAAFVAFVVLSQLLSGAPQATSFWGEWFRRSGTLTAVALALVLAGASVLNRPEIRTLLAWLLWAGVPATAYGLVQLVGADPFEWNNAGWIVATFGNPNFAAAGMAMLALLTAGIALTSTFGTVWRVLMAPLAALEALLALQTGSSQAYFALAAGVGAGVVVWLLRWDSPRRLSALIGVALAGLVGVGLTTLALFGSGPLVRFISEDTLMFRQWYWGAAVRMAGAHPILGVGPDGYGRFYGEFRSEEAASMFTLGASAAHDVPLQWAATIGIPAALLYVALMVTVGVLLVRRLWARGATSSPLLLPLTAVWVAYQVQSLVSIDATSIALLGWMSTGLLLALTGRESVDFASRRTASISAAGAAAVGVLLWIPALLASNASQAVVQGTTEQDLLQATSLVEGTTLPCEPSVRVAQWTVQVAPSEQTVNGVFAGAEADDRCYGLVNASTDFALQLDQPEQALTFAQQGVLIDPLNYGQWILLAKAQHINGDDQAAFKSLQRAVELSAAAQAEVDQLIIDLGLPPLG